MDYSKIRLSSFISLNEYCKLQSYFQGLDARENPESPSDITHPIDNLRINFRVLDDLTNEERYDDLSFNKDYCFEGVTGLSKKYINEFNLYKEDKGIFDKKDVSALVEKRLDTFRDWKSKITKAKYIAYPIKRQLREEIDILDDYLCKYLDNPNPHIKYRIQFIWNRTDVIYFFYLLRINGAIAEIPDGDLGRILDSVMDYSNDDDFKSLRGSRKLLNDYRNQGGKPENPTSNRLKQVFKEDFFNN